MKPTSIISLIVAAMLVIVGFVTCIFAKGMAESDGNSLFSEKRGDNFVNTVSLVDTNINSLDLTLSNASVYIHGKSTNAYAEIVNFNDNNYTFSTSNQVLTFKEVPDLASMLKFWENGFSFKGMRYIFNPDQPSSEDERSVHIYLGTAETKISEITLHAENCEVYIDNVSTGSDFNMFLDNCRLTVDTVSLSNELAVLGEDIILEVSSSILGAISVQSTNLDMVMSEILVSESTDIRFSSGDVKIDLPSSALTDCNISLQSQDSGVVKINGNMVGSSYTREGEGTRWNIISSDGGNISLSDNIS